MEKGQKLITPLVGVLAMADANCSNLLILRHLVMPPSGLRTAVCADVSATVVAPMVSDRSFIFWIAQ